jgi:hypothetical protein
MPLIIAKLIEGLFSPSQESRMIEKLPRLPRSRAATG